MLEVKLDDNGDKDKKEMAEIKLDGDKKDIKAKNAEIWKAIPGYEHGYLASNHGNIFSTAKNKTIEHISNGMKRSKIRDKNGKAKTIESHILVAITFLENDDPEKDCVCHIDGDRTNNRVDNLKWCSRKDISKIRYTHHVDKSGKIKQFDLDNKFIKEWDSITDVIKENPKYVRHSIMANIRGDRKSTYDFIWKFSDVKQNNVITLEKDELFKNIGVIGENDQSRYEISNYGKIKNIDTGKYLQPAITDYGYCQVSLRDKKGIDVNYKVHILVALKFVAGFSKTDNEVNHIDENKQNNYYRNLEWTNSTDNEVHTMGKRVVQMDINGKVIKVYNSIQSAATAFGVNSSMHIIKCCQGKKNSGYGFKWEYAEVGRIYNMEDFRNIRKVRQDIRRKYLGLISRGNLVIDLYNSIKIKNKPLDKKVDDVKPIIACVKAVVIKDYDSDDDIAPMTKEEMDRINR